jgi:hypothetical protein
MHINHLSYRWVQAVRRCDIQFVEIERFASGLFPAYRKFPLPHCQCCSCFGNRERLWRRKGWKVEIDDDAKAGFTLIGSIATNGDRLLLFLIAKGAIVQCCQQFGQSFPGNTDHSKGGWVNQEFFFRFLSFIRSKCRMIAITLVLNQYPAHITPSLHAKARELDIKLILIPKAGTARYQPLDRRISGATKSKACAKFDRH